MAEYYPAITDQQAALIRNAPVFFVASADPSLSRGPKDIGPVNVSPKGTELLHIVSPTRVAYVDYPGSGNETARHAIAGGPVTIMVCSFEAGDAAIVRLYGRARVIAKAEAARAAPFPPEVLEALASARQLIEVTVESTMTSCGYGVPVMTFDHERRAEERGRGYKAPR